MTAEQLLVPRPLEPSRSPFGLPCETVSVVVIGRNEGERLVRCLAAVDKIRYPAALLEKIYVDSESTDGSADRAAEAGFRVLNYRAEFRTAAGARDMGWRASQSRFVLFLDGDCVVDPDFLRHAVSRCLIKGVAAVNGQVRENHPAPRAARRSLAVYWEVALRSNEGKSFYRGGCGLVERAALKEIRGFDVTLAGTENNDLGRRLVQHGRDAWYLSKPMVNHDSGVRTWTELFRHGVRDGYWFERLSRMPRAADKPITVAARTTAVRQATSVACVVAAGGALLGPLGLALGATAAGTCSLVKRIRLVRKARGKSTSNFLDGGLLVAYECFIWCGRMRYVAGEMLGNPAAFRTGPDWRSPERGSA